MSIDEDLKIGWPIYLLIVAGALAFEMSRDNAETKRYTAFKEVEKVADINKDGKTSLDEWAKVYTNLMVHGDVKPYDLSINQLQNYISMHRLEGKVSK